MLRLIHLFTGHKWHYSNENPRYAGRKWCDCGASESHAGQGLMNYLDDNPPERLIDKKYKEIFEYRPLGTRCVICKEFIKDNEPHFGTLWWQDSIPYECPNNGHKLCEWGFLNETVRWEAVYDKPIRRMKSND